LKAVVRYALVGALFVAVVVAGVWPWLDAGGRTGLLVAAGVAYPAQLLGFGLLVRYRGRVKAFLAVWAGGTVVRLGLVLAMGLVLFRVSWIAPAPTLLGLAGLFFGLLLLEPLFFGSVSTPLVEEG
jgi:hypothetical protein